MSKPRKNYESTKQYRFLRWLFGKDDYLCNRIEMQEEGEEENTSDEAEISDEVKKHRLYEQLYNLEKNREMKVFNKVYAVVSVLFCLCFIAVMLMAVSYLPRFGEASNPDNNEVSARYIEKGQEETGAVNIVTGMILDYRAFDTFGESNVLFIAACCVTILLRTDYSKKNRKQEKELRAMNEDRSYEPKNDVILQKVAFFLVPMILIFGIYVILNGHLSPGGGFSGGAIMGAGLILYLNAFGFAKTERFFTAKTYKAITVTALSFYCFAKSYSFFTGANHLHSIISTGIPGKIISAGLILPLNICVGMIVACTMYSFYSLFRKGGY